MITILAISRQLHSVTGKQETSASPCGPPSVPFFPNASTFWTDDESVFVRLVQKKLAANK